MSIEKPKGAYNWSQAKLNWRNYNMEECFFSIRGFGIYLQLTKSWKLQVVYKDNESQWRTKVIFKK